MSRLVVVKVLPNNPFYFLVTSFTKKVVTVPTHLKLAKLNDRPTVVVNMLDGLLASSLDTQFESANGCLICKGKVTKDDLVRLQKAAVQQNSGVIKTT